MTRIDNTLYQAKFTAGGLLIKECDRTIPFLVENGIGEAQVLRDNPEYLGTNSMSSRIRVVREILYRFKAVNIKVWEKFNNLPLRDKAILLHMACLLAYPILRDFHFKVVVKKWKELSIQVTLNDFRKFIDEVSSQHPEIEQWTKSTQTKMGTVALRMLEEANFLQNGTLKSPEVSTQCIKLIVDSRNSWYLEAMLIPKPIRDELMRK